MDMENVSNMLLEARLAKGLTLEEAEAATSIRKLYLDAVEKGEFEKVPGEVFTKGIIRTYGNFLGSAWLKKSAFRRRLNLKGCLPATG